MRVICGLFGSSKFFCLDFVGLGVVVFDCLLCICCLRFVIRYLWVAGLMFGVLVVCFGLV